MTLHLHEDSVEGSRVTLALGHEPQSVPADGRLATAVRLRAGLREARARCVATAEGLAWYTEEPAMVPALQTLAWTELSTRHLLCWPLDRGVFMWEMGEIGFNLPDPASERIVSVEDATAALEAAAVPVIVLAGGEAGMALAEAGWAASDDAPAMSVERKYWSQASLAAFTRRGLPHVGHAWAFAALLLVSLVGYLFSGEEEVDVVEVAVATVAPPPGGVPSLQGDVSALRDAVPLLRRLAMLGLTSAEYRNGELTAKGDLALGDLAVLEQVARTAKAAAPQFQAEGWELVLPTVSTRPASQQLAPFTDELDALMRAAKRAGWSVDLTSYEHGPGGQWVRAQLELTAHAPAQLATLAAALERLERKPSARLSAARLQRNSIGWVVALEVALRGRSQKATEEESA